MPRLARFMAGTITALVAQKKNKDRVNVYLDGKFAFGLAAIEAVKLRRGQALSDEDIARLRGADDVEKAHNRALHFLSFRPRSEAEVRRNLKDGGVAPDAIETVVERLARAGLLDDRAFAQYWLENRGQFRPRSARALKIELRQKGVDAESIDEALQAAAHDEDEAAFQAALPRARRLAAQHPDVNEFKQKLGAFLARRGFAYEVARDAVRRAWEEVDARSPDSPFDTTSED
jgi:regulatory protein